MKKDEFDLKNLPVECQDTEISQDDFKFVDNANRSHEQKFQTKPTTFFKDSIKRFAKNKSSVVASVLLGLLLILSVIVPIIDKNDIVQPHPEMTYLEPKLFESGTGFWDGTKSWKQIPVDTGVNGFNEENKNDNWWPNPDRFHKNAISKKHFSDVTFTSGESKYGKEGYIQFGYYSNIKDSEEYVEFKTRTFDEELLLSDNIYLKTFDTYDLEKLKMLEGDKEGVELPSNYVLGKVSIALNYDIFEDGEYIDKSIELVPAQEVFNIGSKISSLSEEKINLSQKLRDKVAELEITDTSFNHASIAFRLENSKNHKNTCALIRALEFEADVSSDTLKKTIEVTNFSDATECVLRTINEKDSSVKNKAYWISTGVKNIHMSKIVYCDFVYDSYEATFGIMKALSFPISKLEEYREKGWINWSVYSEDDEYTHKYSITDSSYYSVIDPDKSPIVEFLNVECDEDNGDIFCDVMVCYYKFYGYETMPKFLLGTDKNGRDMLKYVFEGLRTSLILGILTFIVCFIFGLIWGSVSGYFGGTVDLVMERFTDILAGVPWIVVMTLAIIKLGSNFWTFVLALCLTGWIGTAATTRTQFYRFRSREYVLASRTLGASDARLIAKHILPNAMGTIITSSVLMIPSVIFSEATISYLGLGLKNLSSLGVILSNNQAELTTNSYLLIFPSVVIAVLMISFNLFGNGLRDAVNPSLKGEGE